VHPSSTDSPPETASTSTGIIGAIPARYASTRLPGKVLRQIAGRTMLEHVYDRARQAEGLSRVIVLTDDERVAAAVEDFGGEVEMTPAECRSGSDRIAHAARAWDAAAVVNIQGDEPLIDPAAISLLARHLASEPGDPMATLAAPVEGADFTNPNVVKVVTDGQGYALYFSRAPIPHGRDGGGSSALRHIGIYGYQREALLRLADLPPTPLERAESLEQLRALENGIAIRVLQVESGWPGVDTMEDLETVERLVAAGGGPGTSS